MTSDKINLISSNIEKCLDSLKKGEFIIVSDSEDRENEGDLIAFAGAMTKEKMAFLIRYSTGIVCTPMTAERAEKLDLPLMVQQNTDYNKTAFTVTTDYKWDGVTTGVSAADRAATCRALAGAADKSVTASDFNRPGHIFPLIAKPGGVRERPGHTEAAVDLLKLAGFEAPVGVIGEIMLENGEMAKKDDLIKFSKLHGNICMMTIEELLEYLQSS